MSIPLLFLGDSPSLRSGLGRIGRDLATLASSCPEFRVGFLGRGGLSSVQLPFWQADFDEVRGWGNDQMLNLKWHEFAPAGRGIIFGIWDPLRLAWLSHGWLPKHPGAKGWLYAPIDSYGPLGRLPYAETQALQGFHRLLAYGEFGSQVLSESLDRPIDWLPHGIDTSIFKPQDRQAARIAMGYSMKDRVVGMVATNQPRKDWGCACETLAMLPTWKGWFHIDSLDRHWDFRELINAFGLADRVKITLTGQMKDTEMSYFYSACDVTMLCSHEGFGYPIAESLACGTPVVHGSYGGGNWGLPTVTLVKPALLRLDPFGSRYVPVFESKVWAEAIEQTLDQIREGCVASVEHLDWKRLWPRWKRWLLEDPHC